MLALPPKRASSGERAASPRALFAIAVAGAGLAVAVSAFGCAKASSALSGSVPSFTQAPVTYSPTTHAAQLRQAHHTDLGAHGSLTLTNASFNMGATTAAHFGEGALEQLLAEGDRPLPKNGLCPPDMASVDDLYCADRYEGSLLEILPNGDERPWPFTDSVEGHFVRAVSEPHVYPQGYINEKQAIEACGRSGKRLCKPAEWKKACMGPDQTRYGYGNTDEPRRCNDHGTSPVIRYLGLSGEASAQKSWTWDKMNDPALNTLASTLAQTGDHQGCTNGYGVYDMVGNLHEWVDDPAGTFLGGFYQDVHLNGDGCNYRSDAHAAWYHDYSTGFRCCADVAP